MKNGKLQIGIIGCGNIANTKHMPNLAKFPDRVEIVAFCDLVAERRSGRVPNSVRRTRRCSRITTSCSTLI